MWGRAQSDKTLVQFPSLQRAGRKVQSFRLNSCSVSSWRLGVLTVVGLLCSPLLECLSPLPSLSLPHHTVPVEGVQRLIRCLSHAGPLHGSSSREQGSQWHRSVTAACITASNIETDPPPCKQTPVLHRQGLGPALCQCPRKLLSSLCSGGRKGTPVQEYSLGRGTEEQMKRLQLIVVTVHIFILTLMLCSTSICEESDPPGPIKGPWTS